jgi:hypothetical protein
VRVDGGDVKPRSEPATEYTAACRLYRLEHRSAGQPRPTDTVLEFLARRLESEPIVLLAALRDGHRSSLQEAGLPEPRLKGLAAAGALLDTHAPALGEAVRRGGQMRM